MYDENPHLSNKELPGKFEGGSYRDSTKSQSFKTHRVHTAIGCIIVSIIALHASNTQNSVVQTGLVFIALINAVVALYLGVLLYNGQNDNASGDFTLRDDQWMAAFILLSASILLYVNARTVVSLVY